MSSACSDHLLHGGLRSSSSRVVLALTLTITTCPSFSYLLVAGARHASALFLFRASSSVLSTAPFARPGASRWRGISTFVAGVTAPPLVFFLSFLLAPSGVVCIAPPACCFLLGFLILSGPLAHAHMRLVALPVDKICPRCPNASFFLACCSSQIELKIKSFVETE
jgi:hypothetical protein